MTKQLYTLLILLTLTTSGECQKVVEKIIKVKDSDHISLDFKFADNITVSTWDRNEIQVKATININENRDNDAFKLDVKKEHSEITIESHIEDMENLHNTSFKQYEKENEVTGGNNIILENNSICQNIKMNLLFEVMLPRKIALDINTISGNINITGLHARMDINTISGYIDLSLPSKHKADLVMKTISGEMYSNFDLQQEYKRGYSHYVNRKYEASLNGGGQDLFLKTISGNIYLRKE